ncbi:S49 family peptidase [Accumulibacter sp.]|uniref:S49 family peptidase n=1 Tax=Accumulibacter sp. TaxID=2053492 RepID=UPI00110B1E17|nr:S49 family peptidase [Candidatus Accumulibacter phosphatis]
MGCLSWRTRFSQRAARSRSAPLSTAWRPARRTGWIGCSASEFYVMPGGEVGSIWVWQAHFYYSQAFATKGIQPALISAGTY